jgi:hypothetical protein
VASLLILPLLPSSPKRVDFVASRQNQPAFSGRSERRGAATPESW